MQKKFFLKEINRIKHLTLGCFDDNKRFKRTSYRLWSASGVVEEFYEAKQLWMLCLTMAYECLDVFKTPKQLIEVSDFTDVKYDNVPSSGYG